MALPNQIITPSILSVSLPGDDHEPSREATASWSQAHGRYIPVSVSLSHPFDPIKGLHLHRTSVRRLLADGLREQIVAANPGIDVIPAVKTWAQGEAHHARAIAKALREQPSSTLLAAAEVVLALETIVGGLAPIRTVQRCMGIEHEDAKRWVRTIRRQS